MKQENMVIVGAGHAGARAAQTLRGEGWEGLITVINAETRAPYERPPLSKAILQGAATPEDTPLFPSGSLECNGIDLVEGVSVKSIQRDAQQIILSNGRSMDYHRLLLALGANPRELDVPGKDLPGTHYLRRAADADAIAKTLQPDAKLVIVGGGLIGLEVAASAVAKGCKVTVVEAGPRLMMRAIPIPISEAIHALHQHNGTNFVFSRQVAQINGDDGTTRAVQLDDGSILPCDALVISIGVSPCTELAHEAGLFIDNGIAVDSTLRTSDSNIFAAGDACSFLLASGERMRLECWKNAEDQGVLAGQNMLGAKTSYDPFPWMWSDQFDQTMQMGGRPELSTSDVERHCGDGTLLVYHLDDSQRIVGVSGFGSLREVSRGVRNGRTLMEKGILLDAQTLADPDKDLRKLAAAMAA